MSEDYSLGKSKKALGPLYPILKAKSGEVIDGFHRQNDDPDWPSVTLENVDTPQKLELARLASNFCRRQIPFLEMQNRIGFLIKSGMKLSEIAEQTGISERTIYRYIPQELKKPEAEKISEGMQSKSDIVRNQLTRVSSFRKTQETSLCPRCHTLPILIQGYCRNCARQLGLIAEPKTPEEKAEAPTAKLKLETKDSWEYRKAQMSPQHSKIELEARARISMEFREWGPCIMDRTFSLTSTTPDFYFPQKKLAIFLDGVVHEGHEDEDEALRELLLKRHSDLVSRYLSVKTKGLSVAEIVERIKHEA